MPLTATTASKLAVLLREELAAAAEDQQYLEERPEGSGRRQAALTARVEVALASRSD